MKKVSVIVPVYNGEKYLRQCLGSICNQTLKEIEIICVDDGSTDSSFEILQEYRLRDNRIQLYRQENKYAGAARNLGKSHASGEYLVFWDCDDYFDLTALEELYSKAISCQADICVCGAGRYYEDTDQREPVFDGYLNKKRFRRKSCLIERAMKSILLILHVRWRGIKYFDEILLRRPDLIFGKYETEMMFILR